jgi:hypothetical protein
VPVSDAADIATLLVDRGDKRDRPTKPSSATAESNAPTTKPDDQELEVRFTYFSL